MGVYIKGMEMPENCDDCLLGADCPHDQSMDGYKMQGGRPRTCPLIPVPPHGRLIDADALICDIKKQTAILKLKGGDLEIFTDIIEKGILLEIARTPTVIEAEGGE